MHSPWDVFIGYMFAAYMILSIVSALCLLSYLLYNVVNKFKTRFKNRER